MWVRKRSWAVRKKNEKAQFAIKRHQGLLKELVTVCKSSQPVFLKPAASTAAILNLGVTYQIPSTSCIYIMIHNRGEITVMKQQ